MSEPKSKNVKKSPIKKTPKTEDTIPNTTEDIVEGVETVVSADDTMADTIEEVKDTSDESDTVADFSESEDKSMPVRLVKVLMAEDFNGCIGGVWYHLNKGKTYCVPSDVKRILNSKPGRLKPL